MGRINSKNKGSTFERKIAKQLSEWAGDKFMRTPMSGAIHNFNDKRVVSDIVAPLSIGSFPFSIECKDVEYSWELNTYLEESGMFFRHWEQACTDADREGLSPMLIFSKNYRDTFVCIREKDFIILRDSTHNISCNTVVLGSQKSGNVIFLRFYDFLNEYKIQDILEISDKILTK